MQPATSHARAGRRWSSSTQQDMSEELLVDGSLARSLMASGSADVNPSEERSAEELARRQRQCDTMTRYRRRKKIGLSERKVEEQFLAAQLQSMLTLHASQSRSYQLKGDNEGSRSQQRTPMDEFVEVLTESERLCFENLMMKQRLEAFHKFEATIHRECEDHEQELQRRHSDDALSSSGDQTQQHQSGERSSSGYWVQFVAHEPPFFYEPFSEEECEAFARGAQRRSEMLESQKEASRLNRQNKSHQVVKLFDWTASVVFESDNEVPHATAILFSFVKTYRSVSSLEESVERDWRACHDPQLFAAIHSVPLSFQVLQPFGDNLSAVIWNSPTPDHSLKIRVMSIFARAKYQSTKDKTGQITTNLSVPPKKCLTNEGLEKPQRTANGERVTYISGSFWQTTFTHRDQTGDVDVEYSGRMIAQSREHGYFLMVELGNMLIRMEHLVFSFRVLPRSSSS